MKVIFYTDICSHLTQSSAVTSVNEEIRVPFGSESLRMFLSNFISAGFSFNHF